MAFITFRTKSHIGFILHFGLNWYIIFRTCITFKDTYFIRCPNKDYLFYVIEQVSIKASKIIVPRNTRIADFQSTLDQSTLTRGTPHCWQSLQGKAMCSLLIRLLFLWETGLAFNKKLRFEFLEISVIEWNTTFINVT